MTRLSPNLLLCASLLCASLFAHDFPAQGMEAAPPPSGAAEAPSQAHGSTKGVASPDPRWSVGIQLGSHFESGIVAQKIGMWGGALNLGLGLGFGGILLTGDYLWTLTSDLDPKNLEGMTYNTLRGQVMPYIGLGLGIGSGIQLRAPLGVQYTMLRDPFNFFGGFTIAVGRVIDGRKDRDVGIGVAVCLGARLLM